MSHAEDIFHRMLADQGQFRKVLFSVFALCIIAVSLVFFALSIGKPYIGTILTINDKGWSVESIDINGLAGEAGIVVGDRPIKINGQPAETFLTTYKEAGVVFGRLISELTVIDNEGQLKSVTLENASPPERTQIELSAWFFACVISWIIGFYVFFKRPRNLAALLLCLCGLAFGLILSSNMAAERTIPTAIWFEVTASVISPWLLLHFFLVLPEERIKLRSNPQVYFIYLPTAITLILFPIIGYADGQPLLGFRTFRLFEYGVGFLAAAGVAIFNYFHAASIRTRQQMKIVLFSCLAALVPQLLLNILPAAMWTQPIIPLGFSILFLVFIPLGMGYAVFTQKLMDIDVIIRRGMIFGLITVVMAAIVSAAIFFVAVFNTSNKTPIQILAALVVGGLAAILFGPLKKRIEILIDKVFYKDRHDYRQVIQSLNNALNSVKNLPDISRLIIGTTVNTLNLMGGCLFIRTQSDSLDVVASHGAFIDVIKQKKLQLIISQPNSKMEFPNLVISTERDVAFIVRLMAGEQEIGILCLAHKVTRQHFSSDDLYLIQGISSVASMALHSAILIRNASIRDTFVSIASHELRTPLTAITGYADLLLQRNPPDSTRRKWLQTILDNGEKIIAMANDLLNVSRIQTGKISLKLERFKLSDILDDQISLIKEFTHKHEFVTNIEPNLPDVIVDHDKFGQVVANLLSNAVKYSPNGGHITLSAHYEPSQNYVVMSIADEGIGISPEDKNSLFTTFHRIQRPETQRIRGSGLGLFIAKEWTELMGGKIWVESEIYKGSTFFVTITV